MPAAFSRSVSTGIASGGYAQQPLAPSASPSMSDPLFLQPNSASLSPVAFAFRWWESRFAPTRPIQNGEDYEYIRRGRLNADILLVDIVVVASALLGGLVSNPATVVSILAVLLLHVILLMCNRRGWVNVVSSILPLLAAGAVIGALIGDASTNGLSYFDIVGYTTINFAAVFAMYLLKPTTAWGLTLLILLGGILLMLFLPWAPDLVALSNARSTGQFASHLEWGNWNQITQNLSFMQTVLGRSAIGLLLVAVVCWRESSISRQLFRDAQDQNARATREQIRREEAEQARLSLEADIQVLEAAVRNHRKGLKAWIDLSTLSSLGVQSYDHPIIRVASLINTLMSDAAGKETLLAEKSAQLNLADRAFAQMEAYWSTGWEDEVSRRDKPIHPTSEEELVAMPAALTLDYNNRATNSLRELEWWLRQQGRQRGGEVQELTQGLGRVLQGDVHYRIHGTFFMETRQLVTPINTLLDRLLELAIRAGESNWYGNDPTHPSSNTPYPPYPPFSGPLPGHSNALQPPTSSASSLPRVQQGPWQDPQQHSAPRSEDEFPLPSWLTLEGGE